MAKQPKIIFTEQENGDWYWISVSPNGRILAKSSESYSRIQKAKEGFNADTKIRFELLDVPIPTMVVRLGYDFLGAMPDDRVIYKKHIPK